MLLKFDKESLSFATKDAKETTKSTKKADASEEQDGGLSMSDKVVQEEVTVISNSTVDDFTETEAPADQMDASVKTETDTIYEL